MRKGRTISESLDNKSKKTSRRKRDINLENKLKENSDKKNSIDNIKSKDIISIVNNHSRTIKRQRQERINGKNEDNDINNKKINSEEKENILDNSSSNVKPIIITFFIIFIIFLGYLFVYYAPIFGITLQREVDIEEQGKIDVISTDENIYKVYGDEILVYSNQTLTLYNSNAKKTWQYKMDSQFTPSIYIHNKYMVISNNSNGVIYLFNDKKEILNMKVEGTINNVYIDDNANIAIDYSTSGHKGVIGVYNKKGINIYNAYLTPNNIIDVKMLNNAKQLVIVQTNMDSFSSGITINKIDIDKGNDIEEIAKINNNFLYDSIIDGQDILCVLDDKIAKFNINTGKEEIIKDFNSNQLMFTTLNSNYYSCIEKDQEGYVFDSKRLNNTDLGSLSLDNIPKSMTTDSALTYLVYQNKVKVINKWGIEVKNININTIPKDVLVFNNGKSVALIYTNNIYMVNISL